MNAPAVKHEGVTQQAPVSASAGQGGQHPVATPAAPSPCVHHFVIATPNGATCIGVCRKCKESRVYSSSGEEESASYGMTISEKRLRAGAAMRLKARVSRQAVQFAGGKRTA
jgi:hypothetical protein